MIQCDLYLPLTCLWAWEQSVKVAVLSYKSCVGCQPVQNPWFSKPVYHLSVEGVKPLKYHLLCVGLVLLCKVPFSLNDKDKEASLPVRWAWDERSHGRWGAGRKAGGDAVPGTGCRLGWSRGMATAGR